MNKNRTQKDNQKCLHRIKYRVQKNNYYFERSEDDITEKYWELVKKSECNLNNCKEYIDKNTNNIFIKNKKTSNLLSFDDIIEYAFKYVEEHLPMKEVIIDGEDVEQPLQINQLEIEPVGLYSHSELTMSSFLSKDDWKTIYDKGYDDSRNVIMKRLYCLEDVWDVL